MESVNSHKNNPLIGLDRFEIFDAFKSLGVEKFRANQMWNWIYFQGVKTFDEMTNFSKDMREKLKENFSIERPEIKHHQKSKDGTEKWLLRLHDGQEVETVFIPEDNRGTLCVSSQVGCTLTCKFCHTGTQTLVRNLTAGEIITQVLVARDLLNDWPTKTENRKLTNIVFMGMGEPLYNYENVAKALKIMMDDEGLFFSRRKITLSTSGVVPFIDQCGEELNVRLAISLHAPNNELRSEIMPLNKKYPLEELMAACRRYPGAIKGERITFEYVMLKDVNDKPLHAKQLISLIKGIPAKINLIPFNAWPGAIYERSTRESIDAFAALLEKAGYTSPIRRPRGEDILAACGQLKSESQRIKKHKTTHDPFAFEQS